MAGIVEQRWQMLTKKAKRELNSMGIAVGLAWYLRDFDKFCVWFFWRLDQGMYDDAPMLAPERCTLTGIGDGPTIEAAIADVERRVFGGL